MKQSKKRLVTKVNLGDWEHPMEYINFKTIADRDKAIAWVKEVEQDAKIEGGREMAQIVYKYLFTGGTPTSEQVLAFLKRYGVSID